MYEIIFVLMLLLIISVIIGLNLFKLINIRKCLITFDDIDNFKLGELKDFIRDSKAITHSIRKSLIYYIISYALNIIFIISVISPTFVFSKFEVFSILAFIAIQTLIPVFLLDIISVFIGKKYLLYGDRFDFLSIHKRVISLGDRSIFIIDPNEEIKYDTIFLISSIIISTFIWIESILYLIISLTTN